MHEMTLMNDLVGRIEALARERGALRVSAVRVRLGALSHISPEHFREHFDARCRGTVAEGARLVVDRGVDPRDPRAQDVVLDSVDVEE
jgi:hydrogenase nickel incorporation protein HypA/HybF